MSDSDKAPRWLIFGHVPPPVHGQSVMVQQLVTHFVTGGGSPGLRAWHVDARFSNDLDDVGRARPGKIVRLFKHCRTAHRLQREHAIDGLLIVPAPAKRGALLRDWLVLALLRRRFERLAYYWQAAGLGTWLKDEADPISRAVTRRLMGRPDLSIVLGESLRHDAEAFESRRVEVIPNFMPDPVPADIGEIIAARLGRLEKFGAAVRGREKGHASGEPSRLRVLFLSTCTRTKGLFDLVEGVAVANARLRESGCNARVRLDVAGKFPVPDEWREFEGRVKRPELQEGGDALVRYVGFAGPAEKQALYRAADFMGLPTYYPAEAFPTALVEAMAWGVPVIATRWRAIPELLTANYPAMVQARSAEEIAACMLGVDARPLAECLRLRFLDKYVSSVGLQAVAEALQRVTKPDA